MALSPPPLPLCNAPPRAVSQPQAHALSGRCERDSVRLAARAVVTAADYRGVDVAVRAALLLGRFETVRA